MSDATPKADLSFRPVDGPIAEPVTKFGGRPCWIAEPAWPLSRATGRPMRFLGQLRLESRLFGETVGEMAYLFMTDEGGGEPEDSVEGTWLPEGGENAVVVQPGAALDHVRTEALAEGPTLQTFVSRPWKLWKSGMDAEEREYAVELTWGEDPPARAPSEIDRMDDEELEAFAASLEGNKVGGTPWFLQGEETPEGGPWRPLLQLDSVKVPFWVNFGDGGIGYAYLSEEGDRGRFLWQCF